MCCAGLLTTRSFFGVLCGTHVAAADDVVAYYEVSGTATPQEADSFIHEEDSHDGLQTMGTSSFECIRDEVENCVDGR